MLFEEEKPAYTPADRPLLPKGTVIDYEIGFLFNFVSGKSTRFDFEPLLIQENGKVTEYKRISLQVAKGLALLQPLDDLLYKNVLEFSDNKILPAMMRSGNRFIRSDSGTWAHASVKELVNLRKHYLELIHNLWNDLSTRTHIYYLRKSPFSFSNLKPAKFAKRHAEINFDANIEGAKIIIKMNLLLDGQKTMPNLWGGFLLVKEDVFYLPPSKEALSIIDLFKNGQLTFPLSDKKKVAQLIISWIDKYPVTINEKLNIEIVEPELQPRIYLSELNESNLMLRPQFSYEDAIVDYGEERYSIDDALDRLKIIRRNNSEEKKLYDYLRTLHPSFSKQHNNAYYHLPFSDVMKNSWFITMMRNVQQEGFGLHGWQDLKKFRYTTASPNFTIDATSNLDWFDLKVTIQWGDQVVSLKEVRRAIMSHQDTIMLEDGTLGHIPPEWLSQYSLLLRAGTEENGTLKISKLHYTLLEEILDKVNGDEVHDYIASYKQKLENFETIKKVELSTEIKASLRPYQHAGFQWLQTLDELGWGGCLADDMGLGKTLQTISFLQFLKEKYPGSTQLVICPTSLIFNWESELGKFCPSIKFHTYYGLQREFNNTHFEEYDVILTTYGMVRNDLEHLSTFLFQYVILDESQAIKNPDAQVTKAVKGLNSVNRIILSGTPVQNNTSDLYAQFSFLNPGLLGTRDFFNREFAFPIDKQGNTEKTKALKRLIHPFTLRRTKEQVAKDLPDKTVTVLWCTMEAEQRKLYNKYRDSYRHTLLKKIDEEGLAKSGMFVLEGLLRLRQICDHPALVKEPGLDLKNSVKIEELVREVQENTGINKLLVFSQFTEMLHIIRENFEEAGISYCYLDGSTPLEKRREQVNKFQEDTSVKAFLISLKAGGVGLNLTVADYVYIVDPWWNPAAEQQAIDRAHRIGQTRKVFAYKMICKDSVEEKILQLQARKKMLADDLIQEDNGFAKNLSRNDIEFLFG